MVLVLDIKNLQILTDELSLFGEVPINLPEESLRLCKVAMDAFWSPEDHLDQFLRQKNKIIVVIKSLILRCWEAGFNVKNT